MSGQLNFSGFQAEVAWCEGVGQPIEAKRSEQLLVRSEVARFEELV